MSVTPARTGVPGVIAMPNHEDWKLLLRRSFGIPDLIDDGVANRSLQEQASTGIPIPAMTHDPSEDAKRPRQ